jgi:hypothetical protein
MDFPASIQIDEIEKTHPGYGRERVADYTALYLGGEEFRKRRDTFVVKRRTETTGSYASQNYADRVKRLHYVNRAGGLIDWLVAAVTRSAPPEIVCGDDVPEDIAEYWTGLNDNADGLGTPLPALVRQSMRNSMTHGRAYYQVYFDSELAYAPDADSLAARMRLIDPVQVDDWQHNDDGTLAWIRAHACERVRSGSGISPSDVERHVWVYFTPYEIAKYEAYRKDHAWINAAGKASRTAELIGVFAHSFGALPVVAVRVPPCNWVMDRIADVVIALLNADLDIAFALAQQAYAQPVLTLNSRSPERISSLIASELSALVLEPGETYTYTAPSEKIFNPLFLNVARLKSDLQEVIQTMSRNAASIPQAGRLSGSAIDSMREPLNTLLASFAWPDRDALGDWVRSVKKYRGEDELDIRVDGLDEFDADEKQLLDSIGGNGGEFYESPAAETGNRDASDDGDESE